MQGESIWKRWKKGMMNLTPTQQLKAKVNGLIGSIVGLILALGVMLYRGVWHFSVFLFFMVWLQVIQYIGTKQQYEKTKEFMEEIGGD